jgi:hypothetical protein
MIAGCARGNETFEDPGNVRFHVHLIWGCPKESLEQVRENYIPHGGT